MIYNQKQLIKMFVAEYPEFKEEDVKSYINLYWNAVKSKMEKDKISKIRVKYFGVFAVKGKRLESLEKVVNSGNDTKHTEKFKKMIKEYKDENKVK